MVKPTAWPIGIETFPIQTLDMCLYLEKSGIQRSIGFGLNMRILLLEFFYKETRGLGMPLVSY
jgi:hypothetical protein